MKQEGGRAALFCVLSQSTLEREFWRENCLGRTGRLTRDEMRRGRRQALGHMRNGFDTP
jgi:hypothetical protein